MVALKPPDRKLRVAFGSGLFGWAPVPEVLIAGGTVADRVSDQRFGGGECLVVVEVELLANDAGASGSPVDEPPPQLGHRVSNSYELIGNPAKKGQA